MLLADQKSPGEVKREGNVQEAIGLCHMAGSELPDFMHGLMQKYVRGDISLAEMQEDIARRFPAPALASDARNDK